MDRRRTWIKGLAYGLMFLGFSFIIGGSVRRLIPVVLLGLFGVYWGMRFLRASRGSAPPTEPSGG